MILSPPYSFHYWLDLGSSDSHKLCEFLFLLLVVMMGMDLSLFSYLWHLSDLWDLLQTALKTPTLKRIPCL